MTHSMTAIKRRVVTDRRIVLWLAGLSLVVAFAPLALAGPRQKLKQQRQQNQQNQNAQQPAAKPGMGAGRLVVKVVDRGTGKPLAAQIRIRKMAAHHRPGKRVAGRHGHEEAAGVEGGRYRVVAAHRGMARAVRVVSVAPGRTTTVRIALSHRTHHRRHHHVAHKQSVSGLGPAVLPPLYQPKSAANSKLTK